MDGAPGPRKTATLTFWAKADAAKSIAVELVQTFGSGGSPSAAVVACAGKVTLSTSSPGRSSPSPGDPVDRGQDVGQQWR